VQCPSCGTAFDAAAPHSPPEPPPLPTEPPPLPPSELAAKPESEAAPKLELGESQPPSHSREEPQIEVAHEIHEPDEGDDDRPWERRRRAVRRDCEPHRGGAVLGLGISSIVLSMTFFLSVIGLGLGIAAWIMGQRDLAKIRQRVMDPEGQSTTQAGWICGIIGTIFSGLMTLGCIAYIGFIVLMISTFSKMTTIRAAPPTPMPQPPVKKTRAMFVPVRPLDYLPTVRP
jgi:hypothetical protein